MGQARGWNSVRGKVSILVGVCLLPTLAVSVVALTSISSVNDNVISIDRHSVRALSALGDLRDMEGDTRVLVWQYLAADSSTRPDLKQEISDADAQADADIADYQKAHGSSTDERGRLMADFVTKLATYRDIRDQQALTAADGGRETAAYTAVEGPLNDANEAMAEPLDQVFEKDVAAAAGEKERANQSYDRARITLAVILLLGVVLAVGAAWWSTRGMLFAIARIRTVMTSGNRDDRVGLTGDQGELVELGGAIDAMLNAMAAQDAEQAQTQDAREGELRAAYVRQQLAEQEVRHRAQSVIDETAVTVVDELQAVVEQAESVLSAGTTIADRLTVTDQATREVVDRAGEADQVVLAVSESLRRVGGIAKLIAVVAEQTNLLALNATIEAARAGEAGRGFSVVAAEVKDLAAQTARSTNEITATVADLERDASAMANVITAMAEGVSGIDAATAQVTHVVEVQRTTVGELDVIVRAALDRVKAMSQLTDGLERRHGERISAAGTVRVRSGGGTFTANLHDISESGLRCSADPGGALAVGSRIEIELRVGSRSEWLPATVVRRAGSPEDGEMAMVLEAMPAAMTDFVRQYIDAVAGADSVLA